MIPAGKLRHRITFEQQSVSKDLSGQKVKTWTPIAGLTNIPAKTEPVKGDEKLRAGGINSSLSHRITVRYQSQFDNPLNVTAMRIVFKTRVFNVLSVVNIGERNHWIILDCFEGAT